ncbi:MAG: HAD-IB family phosphatase [Ardenticatenaceae bacterium]|nr:HAD-IB family phosphatase [Ardenticatenaceae bacterium]
MRWPSYQHIFFDCDSTLSTIEGIDILAESASKKWRVEVLTNAAMNGDIDLAEVYGKRLRAVRPTRQQVQAIKNSYKRTIVEDARQIIKALQQLGINVYIVSGGLYEPVAEFGIYLGVPKENIRAVDIQYDSLTGQWWRQSSDSFMRYKTFEEGALTITDGKADIVAELLEGKSGRSLLIGDGTSDLLASRRVDLFAGFGGVVTRAKVQAHAPIFIHSQSLATSLALILGPAGLERLEETAHPYLAQKCLTLIEEGALTFKDEQLKQKFEQAYQALLARTH